MGKWLSRLAEILFRDARDERLSSEVEHHLDLLAEDYKTRGRALSLGCVTTIDRRRPR